MGGPPAAGRIDDLERIVRSSGIIEGGGGEGRPGGLNQGGGQGPPWGFSQGDF